MSDFIPSDPAHWQFRPRPLLPSEIICHHDFAPYNAVFRGNRLLGMVDWEAAGPGTNDPSREAQSPVVTFTNKEHLVETQCFDHAKARRVVVNEGRAVAKEGVVDGVPVTTEFVSDLLHAATILADLLGEPATHEWMAQLNGPRREEGLATLDDEGCSHELAFLV